MITVGAHISDHYSSKPPPPGNRRGRSPNTMKNGVTAADLRAIREHLGWSQQRMTEYAEGAPIRTYQHWESGDRKPPEYLPRLIVRLLVAEGVLTQAQVDDIIASK